MPDWNEPGKLKPNDRSRIVPVRHLSDGEAIVRELDEALCGYAEALKHSAQATKVLLQLFHKDVRKKCDVYKPLTLWVFGCDLEERWTVLEFRRPSPLYGEPADRGIFHSGVERRRDMPNLEVTKQTSPKQLEEMSLSRYVTLEDLTPQHLAAVKHLVEEKEDMKWSMHVLRCRDVLVAAARHALPESLSIVGHGTVTVTVGGSWYVTFAGLEHWRAGQYLRPCWILATEPSKVAPMSLSL